MKRIERRHLKQNELADILAAARAFFEPRRRQLTGVVLAVALVGIAAVSASVIRRGARADAERLLADAMVALNAPVVPAGQSGAEGLPAAASLGATGTFATEEAKLTAALPKLKAAAEAYPDSEAGITARYHLAGALAALGRHQEAIEAYTDVIARAGASSFYGRMARLGKANAQARAGQLDAAIASWKELASDSSAALPVDAILMELARAYLQKGEVEEARKALSQIVDQHPDSPYSVEARAQLDGLAG